MNLFLFTAQIIAQPQIVNIQNNTYMVIFASIPNNKKKLAFVNLHLYSRNYLSSELLSLCQYKNFILIESTINIKKIFFKTDSLKKKYIEIRINRIHSCTVLQ